MDTKLKIILLVIKYTNDDYIDWSRCSYSKHLFYEYTATLLRPLYRYTWTDVYILFTLKREPDLVTSIKHRQSVE